MMPIEKLRKDYESNHTLYTNFLKEIRNQLKVMLESHGMMKMAEISKRVKKFDSIEQNISDYKFDPKIPEHIGLITDLAGIRIALLFKRCVDTICTSIEKGFEIREKKHIFHDDDQFGYKSVHYEVSLKRGSCSAGIFDQFDNLIAEIQVRTQAQHLWAAATHYLTYKERKDVYKPLQRPLSRISALLELVDEEYERFLNKKEESLKDADIRDSEELNVDSLSGIINKEFPAEKGFALTEGMRSIMHDLKLFEVKTAKDFRQLLNKQKAKVLGYQENGFNLMRKVEPCMTPQSMSFSIESIIRKMLGYEFDKKDGFEFFEKISGLRPGTIEKLISTSKKKDDEI